MASSLATSISGSFKIMVSSSSTRIGFPVISDQNQKIGFADNKHRCISRTAFLRRFAISGSSQGEKISPLASGVSSPGLYSAQTFELTPQNVDLVLEDVRPFLISDGGNVDVVSVEDGVVSLKLQGACTSCPSSSTTMTMGIERVLKEKFGDALKDIRQVFDEEVKQITVEAVNAHLDILRPAIKNYGGSVQVLSVEGEDCVVKYVGPESIGMGIQAAIKEKFKDITNVTFTS
ncbi:PREDICTED: nifU-like protein 1, chloroplastic [Camelina sativa]|uniref:NifU-like protein 1, chloroplastic n=1 Tax=Camelina sativa TaxID=90675 RepID=A0ABM0T8Y4_CAMSA|nr:PREDICTED: nifU-like protein 1, chloroplastic [Camelina sativa]XP_010422672.1 PREDICTED: nifU-like protein 1, chloroplastic [Camelina sativa]